MQEHQKGCLISFTLFNNYLCIWLKRNKILLKGKVANLAEVIDNIK